MSNQLMHLNQLASYLKVQPGKLTTDENSMPVCVLDKTTIKGFIGILVQYLQASKSQLVGKTNEEKAEVYQWLEYGVIYITKCVSLANVYQILGELDSILATKTYFVSHRLTICDVVLYYMLFSHMENLSYLEKEKFLNVSRWFDNMQQNAVIRQKNKLIDFSTSFLSSLSTSSH